MRELGSAGNLPSELCSVLGDVNRGWFLPDRIWVQRDEDGPYVPVNGETHLDRWQEAVYSNRVIVTQFDDGATAWPEVGIRPSCSASMPSAVIGMLAELDVWLGNAVLEIGTGTGYNAALLATLVGPQGHVTTIEVDRDLAGDARTRLLRSGFGTNVQVWAADAERALLKFDRVFDRVLATAAVQVGRLPYTWVAHTATGGRLVVPMRADLASGPLVVFEVRDGGVAIGRPTSRMRVGFMELREQRVADSDTEGLLWDDPDAEVSYTDIPPWPVLGNESCRWAVAVAVPSCRYDLWTKTEDRPTGVAWLRDPLSRSWATVAQAEDRYIVRQFGPRRLWDEVEVAYRYWLRRGEPPLEAWEFAITAERQSVYLP